jgi:Domain of unknown function (DUF4158)
LPYLPQPLRCRLHLRDKHHEARHPSAAERSALLAFPIEKSELIRLYTFSEQDLSVIKQRGGDANRLGFAVLLCALSRCQLPPSRCN